MVVVATLTALKAKEADVEKALLGLVEKVGEEEGTLTYALHRDSANPCVFLFYEKYRDRDALAAHSQTPYFKSTFKDLKELLDGPPEIRMFTELAAI